MKRFCAVAVVLGLVAASVRADEKKSVAMDEKEQAFAELMKDAAVSYTHLTLPTNREV